MCFSEEAELEFELGGWLGWEMPLLFFQLTCSFSHHIPVKSPWPLLFSSIKWMLWLPPVTPQVVEVSSAWQSALCPLHTPKSFLILLLTPALVWAQLECPDKNLSLREAQSCLSHIPGEHLDADGRFHPTGNDKTDSSLVPHLHSSGI